MRGRAMRRLGSSFVTLWIAFFLPSAIIWGLMLRWSIGAAGRVETIWRWMADRLAFPLLLDRPIEWSWRVIADGSPWQATGGFVFLTALWALMFALPLAIIGAWWVWLMSRGKHTSVSGTSSAHDPTMSMAALPSSHRDRLRACLCHRGGLAGAHTQSGATVRMEPDVGRSARPRDVAGVPGQLAGTERLQRPLVGRVVDCGSNDHRPDLP